MSEVTQKRPELKCKVIGLEQWEKERDRCYLACSPIDVPEAAILIAVSSMNVHQYDSSHFLVLHSPSSLTTDRTYLYCASHWILLTPRKERKEVMWDEFLPHSAYESDLMLGGIGDLISTCNPGPWSLITWAVTRLGKNKFLLPQTHPVPTLSPPHHTPSIRVVIRSRDALANPWVWRRVGDQFNISGKGTWHSVRRLGGHYVHPPKPQYVSYNSIY